GQPLQLVPSSQALTATPGPSRTTGGATMTLLSAGALGLFAAGAVSGTPALWYSTDGQHWSRLTAAEHLLTSARDAQINTLLVTQGGVWAAGSVRAGSNTQAAIWTSADGLDWSRVAPGDPPFTADGDHVIEDLALLGRGFVAVGAARSGDTWQPVSWISPDGFTWSLPSEAFPNTVSSASGGSAALGVATANAGTATQGLVAVGGGPGAQRVWTSPDGMDWQSLALPTNAADASDWNESSVETNGTVTVMDDTEAGQPRVLAYANGGWQEISAQSSVFGTPLSQATPTAVAVVGTSLIVAVELTTPGVSVGDDVTTTELLSSTDGSTWSTLASSPAFYGTIQALAATGAGSGLAAAGSGAPTSGSGGGSAVVTAEAAALLWSSPTGVSWTPYSYGGGTTAAERADGLAAKGGLTVAVGQGPQGGPGVTPAGPGAPEEAISWASSDGVHWVPEGTLDATPGTANQLAEGACATTGAFAAVGTSTRDSASAPSPPAAGGVQVDDGSEAIAWTSANGTQWSRATVTPAAQQGASDAMLGCAQTTNGLIAFGQASGAAGEPVPGVWTSATGAAWTRQGVGVFDSAPTPITGLARLGHTLVAVSGAGSASSDPGASAPASSDPLQVSSSAGPIGLWRSDDDGNTWQRLDTTNGPWLSAAGAHVDQAAFLGSTPVVIGSVGGQLAVFVGASAGN
ncbi:MAG: hypothetical protein ACRDYC_02225, partial [Acidimicrobiales bacterium]